MEINSDSISLSKYNPNIQEVVNISKNLNYYKLEHIYGREYKVIHPPNRPTPFLYSNLCKGSIYTNGNEFSNLYLIYDVLKDELIIKTKREQSTSVYIQTRKSRIDSFYIESGKNSSTLINIDINFRHFNNGYYEVIFRNNELQLLLKHKITINSPKGYDNFLFKQELILNKQGVYSKINNKKALLKQYWVHRREIRKRIAAYNKGYKKMTKEEFKDLFHFITATIKSDK